MAVPSGVGPFGCPDISFSSPRREHAGSLSIAEPPAYGAVTWLTGGYHRQALLITGSYFVVGLTRLSSVDAARGRHATLRADRLALKAGLE